MAGFNYWWLIVAYGAFYFFAPHTLHVSTGLGFGLEHSTHQMLGLGMMGLRHAISKKE